MTPIIVTTNDEKAIEEYLRNAGYWDSLESKVNDDGKLNIEELRNWLKNFGYRGGGKKRLFWLRNADQLSNESQNTLLKSLEEMDEFVVLIMDVGRLENLLPTVRSRCLIEFVVTKKNGQINDKDWKSLISIWQGNWSRLITYSDEIVRADALEWIDLVIKKLKDVFRQQKNVKRIKILDLALDCRLTLESNANPKLVVDRFLIESREVIET